MSCSRWIPLSRCRTSLYSLLSLHPIARISSHVHRETPTLTILGGDQQDSNDRPSVSSRTTGSWRLVSPIPARSSISSRESPPTQGGRVPARKVSYARRLGIRQVERRSSDIYHFGKKLDEMLSFPTCPAGIVISPVSPILDLGNYNEMEDVRSERCWVIYLMTSAKGNDGWNRAAPDATVLTVTARVWNASVSDN